MDSKTLLEKNRIQLRNDNAVLTEQTIAFVDTVYPYLSVSDSKVTTLLEKNSSKFIECLNFFKLSSCTTENVDDLAAYLQEKMTKLFTAIHSLNVLVAYGVVSYEGQTNLVMGLAGQDGEVVTKSILEGLLTGIEVTPFEANFTNRKNYPVSGGVISSVPVYKIDEIQRFDISTLMRSLNGQNYTVLFLAKPYSLEQIQNKYTQIVTVRDNCFAVSKRNVSRQELGSSSKTIGASHIRKGIFAEVVSQIKNNRFSLEDIVDSIVDGGFESTNENITESFSVADTVSHDIQNGFALEMIEYCDKAIERLRQGQSVGMWGTSIVYSADTDIAALVTKSCLCGELAKPATNILPLSEWSFKMPANESIQIPKNMLDKNIENPLCVPITSTELGMICTPPFDAVPDFELRQGKLYPMVGSSNDGVIIGKVSDGHRALSAMNFSLSEDDLNKHTFICGITGSGKTTTLKGILRNCDKPFMVIESAKKEYRNIVLPKGRKPLNVYTLGKPELNCLQFNPFYIQCGINLQTHIDFLKDLFNASFSFYGPMPYILEKCLGNVYKKKGWNLTLGYHPYLVDKKSSVNFFDSSYMEKQYKKKAHKYLFPTMQELKDEVKRYIEEEMQYDSEVGGNIKTAILARLESMCVGSKGFMFNNYEPFDTEKIMQENVVFELEGLADDSDKSFCVGMLVIFINEYRQVFKEKHIEKLELQHLLVIEEAHRLLKNVETDRTSENMGNPKGKAVEHFTNMIAEMRSYGQGVIIAEQIPSKLAPDVIKNSSNKIIQRIVSADDQSLIANTIGIKPEDSVYLGSLTTGVALCHKEGMSLPVYVFIDNVKDNYVSDSNLFSVRNDVIFDTINYSIIKEATISLAETLGLKLVNTLMAEDDDRVIQVLKECKNILKKELIKANVSLVVCNNKKVLFGRVMAEFILEYFLNGVYGFKHLVDDDLFDKLYRLCEYTLIEDVAPVKDILTKKYDEQCKKHCIFIVSELIKSDMYLCGKVNVEESIKQYFFKGVNATIVDLISKEIKEEI